MPSLKDTRKALREGTMVPPKGPNVFWGAAPHLKIGWGYNSGKTEVSFKVGDHNVSLAFVEIAKVLERDVNVRTGELADLIYAQAKYVVIDVDPVATLHVARLFLKDNGWL